MTRLPGTIKQEHQAPEQTGPENASFFTTIKQSEGLPLLRPYQAEAGRAILASVLGRKGLTFSVMMARQGGKNELSAQLELLLLLLHAASGGNGIKAAPTFRPQLFTSMR